MAGRSESKATGFEEIRPFLNLICKSVSEKGPHFFTKPLGKVYTLRVYFHPSEVNVINEISEIHFF